MPTQAPEKHTFQAEVKQVLDIVVNSLYTDKEIFIRELVSNGSDALEKLRHTQLTEKAIKDDNLPLEINITTDDAAGTLTLQDFGIGMSHDELVENLGTIAHSGSKAFLQSMQENGEGNDSLIGQFGVGFYSVFMVAEQVEVFTHTWRPDGEGFLWSSDGSGDYVIEPSDGQRRGSKIVVKLKEAHREFSQESRVKTILERYSSFVEFPINLNGKQVNITQAIWLKPKSEITEGAYQEFYKFQAKAGEDPLDWMHFAADAPLSIHALLYFPAHNPEMPGMGRIDCEVALHCRKVLIDPEPKKLFPDWLRFLKGVVDSADLPLNISRESMQDSALTAKLNQVLTKRLIKHLSEMAQKDEEKYNKLWNALGVYLKEGVATDFAHRDGLAPLLRFESSMTEAGTRTGLQGYVDRMKEDQKAIYFITGPNRITIESGPYLEGFKARGIEVLLCDQSIDDFVLNNLGQFQEKTLVSAEQDDLELGESIDPSEGEALDDASTKALCSWLKETLGDRIKEVAPGQRLVNSPVLALNADKMMTVNMRRMMAAMQPEGTNMGPMPMPVNLQINTRHPLIQNLASLKDTDAETAKLVAEQLLDNALISANLLDDSRTMVNRLNQLLERVTGFSVEKQKPLK